MEVLRGTPGHQPPMEEPDLHSYICPAALSGTRGTRALKFIEAKYMAPILGSKSSWTWKEQHNPSVWWHGTTGWDPALPQAGWGLTELHASISPSCKMKANACQPSALRDLINECLSSNLSRDPFNERFHKQCKAPFSWQ